MAHIGQNIARLRGFRQIPQKEMADRLKMAQQTYSAVEKKAEVDEDLLARIADVLGFPVEAIKELENQAVLSINQQGGNTGYAFYQYNPNEKMIELYERMLQEKDVALKEKDNIIELLKKQLKAS